MGGKKKVEKERKHIEHREEDFVDVFNFEQYFANMDARAEVYVDKLSSILTSTVRVEFLLEEIILKYYLGGMKKEKKVHFRDSFLEKAPFPTKVDLLRRIFEDKGIYPGKYRKRIIGELEALNTIRNDFAHHMPVPEDIYPDDKIEYIELGKGLSEDRKNKLSYGTIIQYQVKYIEQKERDFKKLLLALQIIFNRLSKPDPMEGWWSEQLMQLYAYGITPAADPPAPSP